MRHQAEVVRLQANGETAGLVLARAICAIMQQGSASSASIPSRRFARGAPGCFPKTSAIYFLRVEEVRQSVSGTACTA